MTTYLFSNNASATLGSAISPTATSITLAAGTGSEFPSPAAGQFFTATLWAAGSTTGRPNEIVKVTSRVGDTMTVVRGQEGTTAQTWNVGDTFANYITAGFLNQLIDTSTLQKQASNYAVDAGTANAGVVTLVPAPANLAALVGVPIRIKKQNAASTGPYTLNVNAFGNVPVNIGGLAFFGGELAASRVFEVVYNGTTFDLLSPPATINTQQLAGGSVTNAKLAAMAALTLKGNLAADPGQPYDVPVADLFDDLVPGGLTGSNGWFSLAVSGMGSPLFVNYGITTNHQPGNLWNGTFAHAFPNACVTVVAAYYANIAGGNHNQDDMCCVQSYSKTGFVYHMSGDSDDHTSGIFYVAFGY